MAGYPRPSFWRFLGRMRWCVLVGLCCLPALLSACDNAPSVKTYQCEDDSQCTNEQVCQDGKCVKADNDGDGFSRNKDCDDNDPSVYPGRREICDNGKDDNCDGKIDEENCVCLDGKERKCGIQRGECVEGIQRCVAGLWDKCVGSKEPEAEVCDGKDNNCDGTIDEGVPNCCQPEETRPCGESSQGECKKGIQRCKSGVWTDCEGEVKPAEEVCDGKDNDCDGQIDNIKGEQKPLQKPCYNGPANTRSKGECKDGFVLCREGKWEEDSACQQQTQPTIEDCDGKDNDCDGNIDNDPQDPNRPLVQSCYSGPAETEKKGECKSGTKRCVGGQWGACQGEITPIEESCNGLDDDCDGQIDNQRGSQLSLSRPCFAGSLGCKADSNGAFQCLGICKAGAQECKIGRWQACQGEVAPAIEICDGLDNDCDGQVDNQPTTTTALSQPCFEGPAANRGKGECKDGTQTCQNAQWAACTGSALPSAEVCDNKDNDCNGQVDDGIVPGIACLTTGAGICRDGSLRCVGGTFACVANKQATNEICNGLDDNCDGTVDDDFPEKGRNCDVPNALGECKAGSQSCVNGQLACLSKNQPVTEVCGDGKDNNCNGQIDEDPPCECVPGQSRSCYTGPSGTLNRGNCRSGTQICVSGRWGPCTNQTLPSTEVCDSQDNDCDGVVDENNPGGGASCPLTNLRGICATGRLECRSGSLQCTQIVFSRGETCNGLDDDCDGTTDEGNLCSVGQQCSSGACRTCSQPPDEGCTLGICGDPPACVCGYVRKCVSTDFLGLCTREGCRAP